MLPIYVINLDGHNDRLSAVAGQLARVGWKWQRVPAARGATFSPEFVAEENRRIRGRRLTPGEIGCLRSHVACWERLLDEEAEAALVLEDDIVVAPEAAPLARDLSWLPSDDCIVRLEANPMPVVLGDVAARVGRMTLHALRSYSFGSAAYIVTRRRAEALLQQYRQFIDIADFFMFLYPRDNFVYQLTPAPCVQLFDYENDVRVKWPWQQRTGSTLGADTYKLWHERDAIAFFFKQYVFWVAKTAAGIGIDLVNGYSYRKVPFLDRSRKLLRCAS